MRLCIFFVDGGEAWASRLWHARRLADAQSTGKRLKHACVIRDAYFGDAWTSADMVDCILAYAAGVLVNMLTDPTSAEARPMLDALRADPRAAKQLLVRFYQSVHYLIAGAQLRRGAVNQEGATARSRPGYRRCVHCDCPSQQLEQQGLLQASTGACTLGRLSTVCTVSKSRQCGEQAVS